MMYTDKLWSEDSLVLSYKDHPIQVFFKCNPLKSLEGITAQVKNNIDKRFQKHQFNCKNETPLFYVFF